jgi:diaminopimelate decarboxylase
MHHFSYVGGALHAEGVSLAHIAEEVGTPFYCYSTATLERHYRVLQGAFSGLDTLICYAIKANSNQAVIATLARLGAGMDVVSEGELRRARAAGVAADKIIFAGVGKTRDEMAYALQERILGFNVESEPELEALSEVAASLGRTASIAFRVTGCSTVPDFFVSTISSLPLIGGDSPVPLKPSREKYAAKL